LIALSRRVHLSDLTSFPTRRSSDLEISKTERSAAQSSEQDYPGRLQRVDAGARPLFLDGIRPQVHAAPEHARSRRAGIVHAQERSEEHTSELQSRVDLVCRLLLEKK